MAKQKTNSFRDLEIYRTSFQLAVTIYKKSLELPSHDKFEVGSQIRRSSQGIKDGIVEGYGRRKYKADFIKFLVYSHASLLESLSQAEFLSNIYPEKGWEPIQEDLDNLGMKIYRFIEYVEKFWRT
jgi:four helix bundle protein